MVAGLDSMVLVGVADVKHPAYQGVGLRVVMPGRPCQGRVHVDHVVVPSERLRMGADVGHYVVHRRRVDRLTSSQRIIDATG